MFSLFIICVCMTVPLVGLEIPESTGEHVECARSKVDHNVTFTAGHHAGSFLKANKSIASMGKCIQQCCQMNGCDVAFFSNGACYSVKCKDFESCAPKTNTDKRMQISISYVAKPKMGISKSMFNDKNGEPAVADNLLAAVTQESPFLLDEASIVNNNDNADHELARSRRENWKETKDMIIAIGCGFIAVVVGVVGVITMTRQLVEDDDIYAGYDVTENCVQQQDTSNTNSTDDGITTNNATERDSKNQALGP